MLSRVKTTHALYIMTQTKIPNKRVNELHSTEVYRANQGA